MYSIGIFKVDDFTSYFVIITTVIHANNNNKRKYGEIDDIFRIACSIKRE